jgi:predicted GNAT family acetyltransferase
MVAPLDAARLNREPPPAAQSGIGRIRSMNGTSAMTITVTRIDDPRAFLERAGSYLEPHEAANSLPFGISDTLIRSPQYFPTHYLALVQQDDRALLVSLMTPPNNLILAYVPDAEALGERLDQALDLLARDVHTSYPELPGVMGQTGVAERFARRWQALSGQPYDVRFRERAFRLSAVRPMSPPPGALVWATPADRDLLVRWTLDFAIEALGDGDLAEAERTVDARLGQDDLQARGLCLWVDGAPVALAGYTGPTPHGIRVGPVYTPPDRRDKGYASALVAQMSQLLLDGGRSFCFLFTNLANPTANHIYEEIGYEPVVDMDVYRFLNPV